MNPKSKVTTFGDLCKLCILRQFTEKWKNKHFHTFHQSLEECGGVKIVKLDVLQNKYLLKQDKMRTPP